MDMPAAAPVQTKQTMTVPVGVVRFVCVWQ
jgi:hypothetical protein